MSHLLLYEGCSWSGLRWLLYLQVVLDVRTGVHLTHLQKIQFFIFQKCTIMCDIMYNNVSYYVWLHNMYSIYKSQCNHHCICQLSVTFVSVRVYIPGPIWEDDVQYPHMNQRDISSCHFFHYWLPTWMKQMLKHEYFAIISYNNLYRVRDSLYWCHW